LDSSQFKIKEKIGQANNDEQTDDSSKNPDFPRRKIGIEIV